MIKELFYGFWDSSLPDIKTRNFDVGYLGTDLINDVIGIRRCGKTYLMFLFMQHLLEKKGINRKQILYLNFENRRLYPLKSDHFNNIVDFIYAEKLLDNFDRIFLFLDEVQNIDNWEKQLRSIYDEFKGKIKTIISGSNASLLKEDYATLLTGRHLTINLYPLSFKEFLNFSNFQLKGRKTFTEKEKSLLKKHLGDYLKFGGFPEVVLSKNKEPILQQYFSDIVTRDIISREKIRKDPSFLEELAIYLINNTSNLFSLRKISNFFTSRGMGNEISVPTVQKYLRSFENAFLFLSVKIFSYKIKEQLQYPQKIYCVDTGLINALSSKFSHDWGRLYENAIAVELKRRKCEIYYWKDSKHNEVDFVIKKGLKISSLIQVCYDFKGDNYKREVEPLIKCSKELKCKNLILITENKEGKIKEKGMNIKLIPLYKFLLLGMQ